MSNELMQLIAPIKELLEIRDELKGLVVKRAKLTSLSLSCEKFHGKMETVSFRTYKGVADDFRAFSAGFKGMKCQDLLAQALVEFMEKYQDVSVPPISLTIGKKLSENEVKEQTFSKMIKEARGQILEKKFKSAPQVRIYDSQIIGPKNFTLKTDDGREFTGVAGGKFMSKLKSQIHDLLLEKAK